MSTTDQPLISLVQPVLETPRLVLRAFRPDEAARTRELAGDFAIADTTVLIPHPYPEGAAEKFIALIGAEYMAGRAAVFAVTLRETGELVGSCGLTLHAANKRGELGYWIGRPYWNHGYGTEAARAVMNFGFEALDLGRIYALCMSRNPPSLRILEKLGMLREGLLRRHLLKWEKFEDVLIYGVLREEFNRNRGIGVASTSVSASP